MNQPLQTQQLNPYAIQLCTLGRWITQRQWLPCGSGLFSVRTSEHSALFTAANKDKNELSPADLIAYDWAKPKEQDTATAIHQFLYQLKPQHKVVLQTHGLQTTVFSRLIKADQHLFVGYELQQLVAATAAQRSCCPLAILDPQSTELTLQELHQRFERETLAYAFLIRGHGLYVWGDCIDSAKRHLETWQFLIACELERIKASALLN
ncbi:MAG: class II aldolase/adducin family protein [Gammaproteobacteria bacterium]|nr:class II aldolase/adducin family protein [Gammaproteobacteria bacterium]MBU2059151.1 class II aldolase/adducin family protein [Gammaproteobacteria bacterium]MBU2173702.1 class II aldolase/adducin family protein [Gammaproteobacteria bacterium]MBU2246858.1 class II aldolase/adducin family protein [Gammaproteobacteria bacterium]MBU2343428.1 class II aldolase/adducin family protein [Gammaproteobacteria bacterium]